jgi:predicted nucleic acid-binding protein
VRISVRSSRSSSWLRPGAAVSTRSPGYSRLCDILPDDERTGRAAGLACAAAGTADVVDAIVIVTAIRHQAPIVTSDPGDLTRIADSIGVKIRLFRT